MSRAKMVARHQQQQAENPNVYVGKGRPWKTTGMPARFVWNNVRATFKRCKYIDCRKHGCWAPNTDINSRFSLLGRWAMSSELLLPIAEPSRDAWPTWSTWKRRFRDASHSSASRLSVPENHINVNGLIFFPKFHKVLANHSHPAAYLILSLNP